VCGSDVFYTRLDLDQEVSNRLGHDAINFATFRFYGGDL
jgi:hypothetical protein